MLLFPLLRQPVLGLTAVAVIAALALAARSPAYPLALGLISSPLFAIIGFDPLPKGAVVEIVVAWTALGILLWFTRRGVASRGELFGPTMSAVPVLLSLVLVGVMIARLGASPASSYGGQKLELFLTGAITVLVAGMIVGRDAEDFDLFVGLTLAVATVAAGVLFVQLAGGRATAVYIGRFSVAGSDPITLGRLAGVGLLLGMYLVTASRTLWVRMYALSALPLLAVGIVATGGRGPVVGVTLGLIVFFAFVGRDPVSRRRIPLTLVGALAAVVLVSQFVPGQAVNRALSVLSGTGAGISSNGRSELWSQAFNAFSAHPFVGLGTGGFASLNPVNVYPHNLLLEVGSELGLLGLLPMIGILITGAATLVGNWRGAVGQGRARAALVIALFAAAFTNAMVSGDLTTNGGVWLALGLGVGLAQRWSRPIGEAAPRPREGWTGPALYRGGPVGATTRDLSVAVRHAVIADKVATTTRAVHAPERGTPRVSRSADARSSAYERRFAEMLGGDVAAFAFWKGRVSLYAILRAMGIGPGDEVVVPGFTCVAVPNAVRFAGATPVYADIEPGGFNLDPASVERQLTPRGKAIVVQHTFGMPAALDEVLKLAQAHDVRLIEDCAHTVTGAHKGRRLGTVGDAAFYSFQWSKPYTTGLGGMAVTRDGELAERLRAVHDSFVEPPLAARMRLGVQYQLYLRFFSSRRYWLAQNVLHAVSRTGLFIGSSSEAELAGREPIDHTWRMARFQQTCGRRLVGTVGARAEYAHALAGRYEGRLSRAGWVTPEHSSGASLLRYPMLVANREELQSAARAERIELGSWFESPLHPLPLEWHHRYGYAPGHCPNAERCARQIVNLPLHLGITFAEADRVAQFFIERAKRLTE